PSETIVAMEHIKEEFPSGTLIKLVFVGERTGQPVITSLIRKFMIDVNIVQGNIAQTHDGAYGTLILQLVGEESIIQEAIHYLNEQDVRTEVIGND
ncbi:methionine ABC transporter ATP-binding protein, partial [Microvirga sp. 3-52]|nr:methionine ABC transporter ATP-binding protein [Microvirga sp. 3-52]